MKVIFMGTPTFACPTLELTISNTEFEILAVYTKEPAISGRGKKVNNSPIHNLALKHNLKVITPKTLRDDKVKQEFLDFKADACIVVAYGLILPKEIIKGTKYGCINLHPSLLPKWRGAAPIQRQLMSGDKKTATCVIKMDEGLDSGDIITQEIFNLDTKINFAKLAEKFANDGANLVIKSLNDLKNNSANLIKQDHSQATYAKKILKEEALIDFNKSAQEVNNQIRGLSGNIGAYFELNGERIKIHKAKIIDQSKENKNPSQILNQDMHIACKNGIIQPEILQKAGKPKINLAEFLKGNKIL